MSVVICGVEPDSQAEKKHICAGDMLISVNGNEIEDVLDYQFFIGAKKLKIVYEHNGKRHKVTVRKREYDDIGLNFDSYLMDKQQHCKNKCIFCFIDQLPDGMRDTLYFKDDDSRMSFLFGNYITLTNISEHEIERIIKMHISPINISVHTTNPELRVKMMKNPYAGESLQIMYRFAEAGTKINCQLVLCPGWNDGDELKRTLADLIALYPAVQSIACVPIGKTKYREGLEQIDSYTADTAADVIDIIEATADKCMNEFGERLVYASDEFYIKSGRKLPDYEYYGEFDQLENGVGMCTMMRKEFDDAVELTPADDESRSLSIATGMAILPQIREMVDTAAKKWHNADCRVYGIVNDFFGHEIDVTGLITGKDLIAQLKGKPLGDRLLLSVSMFRSDGDVMLDDVSVGDIERELNVKVQLVNNDGGELLAAILEQN